MYCTAWHVSPQKTQLPLCMQIFSVKLRKFLDGVNEHAKVRGSKARGRVPSRRCVEPRLAQAAALGASIGAFHYVVEAAHTGTGVNASLWRVSVCVCVCVCA